MKKDQSFSPDPETQFMEGMIQLNYGVSVEKKLRRLASQISWAQGWPENNTSFWNAEAFMWDYKIDKDKRALIQQELSFLLSSRFDHSPSLKEMKKGRHRSIHLPELKINNLDLGCGSYSYLPSVGFDISQKMLDFNTNCKIKVQGDLEKPLSFRDQEFSSVTAVFVFNYIQNYPLLLSEIHRIIQKDGLFIAVLYTKLLNRWQKQKQVNDFSMKEWTRIIVKQGFKVTGYKKENLLFLRCKKNTKQR